MCGCLITPHQASRAPELFLDIPIADALVEQKNDPHALRHTCRQIPAAREGVPFAALRRSQVQDFKCTTSIFAIS